MEGFGEFIGWLIAAALTVVLVVFLGDKIGIWDICAIWDTSCGVDTRQPKDEPKPIARQSVPTERVPPKQEKQDRGSSLPKALLPELHIGPWTINKGTDQQSVEQAESSAQVKSNGQISSDFTGRWSGKVMQTDSAEDEYEVDITITPGGGNERVGTANYITVSWMKNVKNTALMCSAINQPMNSPKPSMIYLRPF